MRPWSCDPARIARWKAIDRERARRIARDLESAPEPTEAPADAPAPAPAREPRPERRRFGVAAEPAGGGGYRVSPGPRGGD